MGALLSKEKGRALLELARKSLAHRLAGAEEPRCPEDQALHVKAATFVTLKIEGRLRGCIGTLEAVGPLWEGVRDNAVNAAFHDSRFSPLQPEELQQVHLDVSVLTEPEVLHYDDAEDLLGKLRPNIDGVILSDGRRRATFLPQVWQQLPDPSRFLDQLCTKAGLSPSAWREKMLDIRIYQVQSFAEENP
jgi:AmmeMemoRadiSam system protein A